MTERLRILVTGTGGAGAFDLARFVQRLGHEVIAADSNPYAPGLRLPEVTALHMPPAGHPHWADNLLTACRTLRPDALWSAVEAEFAGLARLREPLADLGVRSQVADPALVQACVDKHAFHRVLTAAGIATPRLWEPHQDLDIPAGTPLVVKPARGQGARQVTFCHTGAQAHMLRDLMPDAVVQERLRGTEFTADAVVDAAGRASVVLRRRLLVKGGLAVVAETFHDPEVAARVTRTLAAVGARGLCCAQGFITTGPEPVVMTEVNARVGGGFPLAEHAGADLVAQGLNALLGRPVDHSRLAYEPGLRLTKYTETLTVETVPCS